MIEITIESWDKFYPVCLPLFKEHEAEIGENNMPLDVDVETCATMDKIGMALIVVAYKDGIMIGYCTFFLSKCLMSKNILIGTQGPYFVTKEERKTGAGLKLYREAIKQMKEKGVKNIYPHHYLRGDSAKLGAYFENLGATLIQYEYSLWIGEK